MGLVFAWEDAARCCKMAVGQIQRGPSPLPDSKVAFGRCEVILVRDVGLSVILVNLVVKVEIAFVHSWEPGECWR